MTGDAYYQLWFDDQNSEAIVCEEEDLRGLPRELVYRTEPLQGWPADVTFYCVGKFPEDYLFATLPGWILISRRVQRALEGLRITDIEFLPVRVQRRGGIGGIADYAVLHVVREVPAVDWSHSRITQRPDPGRPRIAELTVFGEAVDGLDLFRLQEEPSTVLVSQRVRSAIDDLGATGFHWKPVRVS